MLAIEMDELRRESLVSGVQAFFLETFEEDLSAFRAEQLLDFFLSVVGPAIYNQAIQDARIFMQKKLDDLDADVHEPDGFIQ